MKVILSNTVLSIVASSQNPNFTTDNLFDVHPKLKWKAVDGVNQATMTCDVATGSSGGAIFGTNAVSASVTGADANYVQWVGGTTWVGGTKWDVVNLDISVQIAQNGSAYAISWQHALAPVPMTLTIDLTAKTGDTVEAGVLVSGEWKYVGSPEYGIKEGSIDYSIENQLSNGARYYKKRDIVRTFDFTMRLDNDTEFYPFMSIGRDLGRVELAWNLTDLGSSNWLVYGFYTEMPEGTHDDPFDSGVHVQITEVV